ncbi:MAG: NUDIX hydrolase [Pelagimonas sp.]|jgi:8-oxo-dGTP diphosphatase|nr:NUDIX hydrolase [Pelagimonas sp.]
MTPRFGTPPALNRRYILRPGAYAILARGDRLLLTHQAEPTPEFQLPGGGIDPGEGPLQALHREVYEETGWRITRPRRLGAFRRFTYMPEYDLWAEKLCIIYVALPTRRMGPPTEYGHIAVWMSPAEAMQELGNPGDRAFVSKLYG